MRSLRTPVDAEEPANEKASTWINTDLNATFDSHKATTSMSGDAMDEEDGSASSQPHRQHFFCNSQYFVLYPPVTELLYSRLHKVKALGVRWLRSSLCAAKLTLCHRLGLQDGCSGPAAVVGAAANLVNLGPVHLPTKRQVSHSTHRVTMTRCSTCARSCLMVMWIRVRTRRAFATCTVLRLYRLYSGQVIGALIKVVQFLPLTASVKKCRPS